MRETGGVSVGVKGKERDADGSKMLPPGETDGGLNSGVENPDGESSGGNVGCGGTGVTGPGPPKGGINDMMMMLRSFWQLR